MEAYSHSSRPTPAGRRGRRGRHRPSAFLSWRRQALLLTLALALALATIALLMLGDAMGVLPGGSPLGAPAVHGAAIQRKDATPTSTPSGPGTLNLVSPSSARGPAGATLTFSGSGWGTTSVAIGASLSGCSPVSNWQNNTITNVTPDGSGSFTASGQWPGALTNVGTYTLCAYDGSGEPATGPSYSLLTASPPSITLSATTAQVSQQITITGANFLGVVGVQLTAQGPGGSPKTIGAVTPDSNGAFTTNYAPAAADVGAVTITASSVPEGGAPAALTATTNLTVNAANTPTPTVSPTATVSTSAVSPNSTSSGPSLGLIIGLVVGILLALLIIAGVVTFLILRRRNAPNEGAEGDGYYDGRDPTGRFPSRGGSGYGYGSDGYGRGYSEEFPSAYGAASGYVSAPGRATRGYPDPYASSGAVAAWDDPPPDPSWRARPMTGRHFAGPDDSLDGLDYPELPPTGAPGDSYDAYPTRGGWDEATGGYTNETGAYGPSGYTDETGAYGGAPYDDSRTLPGSPYSNDGYGGYNQGGPPSGRRPTPGRAGGYPPDYGGSTRPAGPPAGPGYPPSAYPPAPLVPPGASGPGGPRSSPGRGGPTGGRGSAGRPPQPDPRRGGWDDPDATDDGRGGW